MTSARNLKQHFWKPLGKKLGDIWDPFGKHLGAIWGLEAEEASGRHLDSILATPPQRNAKVPFNLQLYEGFLRVGVPKYCNLQYIMVGGSRRRIRALAKAP